MNTPSENIIEASNIHRKFGKGELMVHVLKGISLSVKKNEFLAIMGKSGAGKSTLLYQLSALDDPNEGTITINDTCIDDLSESDRTDFRLCTLGYVFQDYALVPDLDARENVILPLLMRKIDWHTASSLAESALDSVGLPSKYTNLPSELSGGEQQRVSIARAIAGKPKIIFADEPTANLDNASGKSIIELLIKLHSEGQTIVMVTHEEEYTRNCDRVIYIDDGKITSEKKNAPETFTEPLPYINPCYTALEKAQSKR